MGRASVRLGAIVAMALCLPAVPASAGTAPVPETGDRVIEGLSRRLFPLFDALGREPAALAALAAKSRVAVMLHARAERRAACDGPHAAPGAGDPAGSDPGCTARALLWSYEEARVLAAAVPGPGAADDGAPAQALREIGGINAIIRTYGLGEPPAYPQIDGAGTLSPEETRSRLQAAQWLARTPRARSAQALDPSIDFALALLDGSDRTDAIGYEPLSGGLNAAAMQRAAGLDWSAYRLGAMIVTGVGPEAEGMPLSALGKYHLRLAAQRFAQGDIPFIILSGGRAHPRGTRFAEAEEMRRALIARYGVPADAIVIEPYARHTTTNLRNAARLMAMLSVPQGKPAVIVCNPAQSAYIESAEFAARNMRELGYQPGTIGPRVSPTEIAFTPSAQSARVDPRDPLDP